MPPYAPTLRSRRGGRTVAALALAVYLATAGGSLTSVDAVMTYEVTRSLITRGTSAFDEPGLNNHPGVDGRYYSPFGIGQSLVNVPFYVGAAGIERFVGPRFGKPRMLEKAGVALGNAFVSAGIVWVVYAFAFRLTGSLNAALFAALASGFGTLVWPYAKFGFNQPLTSLCLTGGVVAAWLGLRLRQSSSLALGGASLAFAFLTRHEMALAVAVVAAWMLVETWRERGPVGRRLLAFGGPVVVAVAFWLWYNQMRFGNPFDTGNLGAHETGGQHFGFSLATLTGMVGLLFSPGRSLVLYVPLVVVAPVAHWRLAARDRALALVLLVLYVSFLVLYGSLRYWDGLRGYGPRYLVPFLPLVTAACAVWARSAGGRLRRFAVAVACVSALVQLPGVLMDFSKVSVEHARLFGDYSREAKILRFSESAVVLNARAAATALPLNVRYLATGTRPPVVMTPATEGDQGFSQRFSFSLDFWWLYLYYLGVWSSGLAVSSGAGLLAVAAALLRSVPRDAAQPSTAATTSAPATGA